MKLTPNFRRDERAGLTEGERAEYDERLKRQTAEAQAKEDAYTKGLAEKMQAVDPKMKLEN